ncbi:methionyl-tRNA formyltransferase [Propionicimonas sp.]|uniref:methionyl-tRNA formyltransferase n=1 Tax=Propionicimonas sp. TaxID=1955623 RepID=UPI0039E45352
MRLVFAGTPQVAADTLLQLLDRGRHDVVAVLTRPDAPQGRSARPVPSPVATVALDRGIEVLRPVRPGDPDLATRLAELAPDCCPIVAYGGLIPPRLLALPGKGWVNVHFSLLPRWRGAAPVQHAILAGDQVTGVTVFELVEDLDAGPVLATRTYPLGGRETSGEVLADLQDIGAALLADTLDAVEDGTATPVAQPVDGITLAPKLTVPAARIDWAQPAAAIDRQVRANNPSPMAWTDLHGERLRVLRSAVGPDAGLAPGEIVPAKREVLVGTGEGSLALLEVQPAGRKSLPGPDWGRGLRGPRRLA